jgi:GPH family glycoside/pentoside/hexuronide:cation symporter
MPEKEINMADSAQPVVAAEDRVPFWQKMSYGSAGVVDILSVWVLVSIAYQVFQMELKMSFNQVALILMSLRLWDGIADPIMGWISDNTRTRWGRRRPYILVGAVLSAITYPLIWWFPRDLTQTQTMGWVIGFGILFYTCFTIWAMPFQSLLMEMTPDYNERTRTASVRGIFQTLAGLFNGFCWWLSMLPVFYVNGVESPINGMRYISLGIAVTILLLGPLPALFVKERYYESDLTRKQAKISLRKSLKETLSCRVFIILCVVTVLFLIGTSIFDSYGRYVGTYYVLGGEWSRAAWFVGLGTITYTVTSLIMIQVFKRLSEKIGKINCLFIAMGLVLFSVSITWWTNNPKLPYLMLVNSLFVGAGYAGIWLMIPSMQVDVVDYDELKTGERREGSFASIFSWVLKLSFCLGFMLSGPLLQMTGFNDGLEGAALEKALTNMRIGYIVLPVVTLLIAVLVFKFFPLSARRVEEIRGQLEERRGKV